MGGGRGRLRKNKVGGKVLSKVFAVYEIRGLNLDYFINTVRNKGIDLYDVKKIDNKCMIVSVSLWKSKKFFAIAKELCYNIKKVREKGKGYPLLKLARSFGMVIGAIVFMLTAYVANDTLFDFSFTGSGSVYKREVMGYLNEQGVKQWVRFSSFDLQKLEDGILASNSHLSFASCKKQGSVLNIELVLSQDEVDTLDGNVYSLTAPVDGVVEKIKVYRGTAQVDVGDAVNEGDLLVGGYAVIKDQTVKINVLATVTLKVEQTVTYRSVSDCDENNALIFAQETLADKEILSSTVQKFVDGKEYIYKVTTIYRQVIVAG